MKRMRGFLVGRRVVRTLRRVRAKIESRSSFFRNPIAKIESLARRLRLRLRSGGDRYRRIEEEEGHVAAVEKGHVAVYVGEEFRRVVVPVKYLNHPLFGELLREAEEVYGFDHPGGIAIPCGVAEFEMVKRRIAAAGDGFVQRRRNKCK